MVYDAYEESYYGTVGIDFCGFMHRDMELQMWDTAGQERFYSIIPAYIRNTAGVFLVFDANDRHSFSSMRSWFQMVMRETSSDPCMVVIGNKNDTKNIMVTKEEASTFSKSIGAEYVEASALTGEGVLCALDKMVRLLEIREKKISATEKTPDVSINSSDSNSDLETVYCSKCT